MQPDLLRSLPISAASGLVRRGDSFYVVADDELGLLVLPDHADPFTITLLPGVLPEEHAARKAHKPDFEALCRWPGRGLLALGSGSTLSRRRACLLRPGPEDMFDEPAVVVELGPLHDRLAQELPALNLEGAAVVGDALLLFQRGNGVGNRGAVVELELAGAVQALSAGDPWTGDLLRRLVPVDLGDRGGSPLGFTDAPPLPDGSLIFVAAAESSLDTYLDGALTGAAIGRLGPELDLLWLVDLPGPFKLEGVHAEPDGDAVRLWLVNDPDDRTVAASLLHVRLDLATGAWRPA